MNKLMRVFSAVSVAVAVLTAHVFFALPVRADSGESLIISGDFDYLPSSSTELRSGAYHYSDTYFSYPASVPNAHLRTMSLCLSLTAFGAYGGDNAAYAEKLLKETGFGDITAYDMNLPSSYETVGTVIAHKNTDHGEVIAVVIRGGYYGLEWQNTLDAGESGDAAGIASAAEKVVGRIKSYEHDRGLSGAKLWVTGYSRGGAAADLTGRYINEHLSEFGIRSDDAYICTFEAPAASAAATGYANIRNVCVSDDIIPMFFPESWGLHRAGTEEQIKGVGADIRRKYFDGTGISDTYTLITGRNGLPEKKTDLPISCETAEREFMSWLSAVCGRSYYTQYSPCISRLVSLFVSGQGSDSSRLASYLAHVLTDAFQGTFVRLRIVGYLSTELSGKTLDEAVGYISGRIAGELESHDHSGVLTDEEYEQLMADIPQLTRFMLPIVKADFSLEAPLVNICTFLGNTDEILSCHRHESVLALVMAQDTYYSPTSVSGAVVTVNETTAEVISVEMKGKRLTEGIDYTVSFRDSEGAAVIPEKSGKYTAVITGTGNWFGTQEKEFTAVFPHYHEWQFSSLGSKASVKCISEDCSEYTTGKEYTVTVTAPGKDYDGSATIPEVKLGEALPAETAVTAPMIRDESGNEVTEAVEPGRYTAELILYETAEPANNASAKVRFEIRTISLSGGSTVVSFEDNTAEIEAVVCGGRLLIPGEDYTVTYLGDDGSETEKPQKYGKYCAKLTGTGHYSGTYRAVFEIEWRPDTLFFVMVIGAAVILVSACITAAVIAHKRRGKTE